MQIYSFSRKNAYLWHAVCPRTPLTDFAKTVRMTIFPLPGRRALAECPFSSGWPVGNVYVVLEIFGGCILLEVVADIHFQLGPGLELPLPVVESVHVGIAAKAKTDAMDAMERAPGE